MDTLFITNSASRRMAMPAAALILLFSCNSSSYGQPPSLGTPSITATTKGPNQINLTWPPVADPGYGYLVEIQSQQDSRYSAWTEMQPIPSARGYACDNKVTFNNAVCNISDPSGASIYRPPTNGIPYWVTEKTYLDPQDGSPAQFIAAGLKPNTAYTFRVRAYAGQNPATPSTKRGALSAYGPYSNTSSATTANYAVRYVSPQGDDKQDGKSPDPSHAWRTLAHAAGSLTCGQVLIVMGGAYRSDTIFLAQKCTPQNKVVVLVNPGDTATIHSSPGPGAPALSLTGTSGVIDGIVSASELVQPSTEYDVTISGSHNALFNAEVRPPMVPTFTHYGIMVTGEHNFIYRSYVHDFGSPDATQNPSGNGGYLLTLYGVGARHNVMWSNHFTRGGHDCSLCKVGCNNNRWLNNIMDGGWGSAWQVVGPETSAHNLFEGNIIKDVGRLGKFYKPAIQLSSGYNTVRRNISINCASSDIEVSALYGANTANNLIYNNTFYSPVQCLFQSHATGVQAYDNNLFVNNICYKFTGGAANMYLGNKTGSISYNNMLFMDKNGRTNREQPIIIWNHDAQGPYQYPVPLAVADSKYNPPFSRNHGLDVDPQFVDEAKGDFVLKPGSKLIGAGTSVKDSDWGSTAGKVDLGAFGIHIEAAPPAGKSPQ